MQQSINPAKQTVVSCLQNKTYHIDFYQREYVWQKETVEVFLNDVFYAFTSSYEEHKDADFNQELLSKFNWYYLNVIITNNIAGKVYVVDGQQRLSTLTLIALKLYHMTNQDVFKEVLKNCISGQVLFEGNVFVLDNNKRKNVMNSLFANVPHSEPYNNKTEETLVERYKDISKYIDDKKLSEKELSFFIGYFLTRLVLVELDISQDDTPMVFEVINDRGEPLKSFEILKGKLIGKLSKSDTEIYAKKWDDSLQQIRSLEDAFFVDYLKSRFIYKKNSQIEGAINNAYHRYLFENNEIANTLAFRKSDKRQLENIKNFISEDLRYFSALYAKIKNSSDEFIKYNRIHDLSGQYQIILSACDINDSEEDAKIALIAKEFDRLHILLKLNRAYDSNTFQEISYSLNEKIRNSLITDYREIFDAVLIKAITTRLASENINSLLEYNTFLRNDYTNTDTRTLRYILARIENYICSNMNQSMQYNVEYISTRTGAKTGFHIEHILSRNETNKSYFSTEEEFEQKRNILGGLLLLEGVNNISSGNEDYINKIKTYSSGLVWGHSLNENFYHNNHGIKNLNIILQKTRKIELKPYKVFDIIALEERSVLLFNLIKIIWEVD